MLWVAKIGLQGKSNVSLGKHCTQELWFNTSTNQQHVMHEAGKATMHRHAAPKRRMQYQMSTALLHLQQHHSCLQAEFESRCEMYEAQVTKMQRSMERSDTEKARVEEQLATAIAFNHSGDKQVYLHRQV